MTATDGEETLVVAESLVEQGARATGWTVGDTVQRCRHGRLDLPAPVRAGRVAGRTAGPDLPDAHFVVNEDYVTAEDGTGLVHQSPAFGEDDFRSCRRNGVAMVNPIDTTGALRATRCRWSAASSSGTPTADLVDDLTARGLLFRHVPYEHSYPHCWRCHTALLYYAQPSWYVRTTADQGRRCSRENEETNWYPVDDQARPLRRLAGEQHRLGALAQPLLGHAAADLALRRGPPDLRRLAGRALRRSPAPTSPASTRTGPTSTT